MIGRTKIILAVAGIIGAGAGGCILLRNYLQKPQQPIGIYGNPSPWPDGSNYEHHKYHRNDEHFDLSSRGCLGYDGENQNYQEEPKLIAQGLSLQLAKPSDSRNKMSTICDKPRIICNKNGNKSAPPGLFHPSIGLSSSRSTNVTEQQEESDK